LLYAGIAAVRSSISPCIHYRYRVKVLATLFEGDLHAVGCIIEVGKRRHSPQSERTLAVPRIEAKRSYLHGFPWLDAHHFHREAPPDQQDAGRSLTLEVDAAGSGYDPSATFGPSTTFGLERESENSFGRRGEPFAVSASPDPPGARSAPAGGLTSASRRSAGGASLGGKAFFAAISRSRCAGGRLDMSPGSG
jgi:hypothetical protein